MSKFGRSYGRRSFRVYHGPEMCDGNRLERALGREAREVIGVGVALFAMEVSGIVQVSAGGQGERHPRDVTACPAAGSGSCRAVTARPGGAGVA